jgi:hypothetical protein
VTPAEFQARILDPARAAFPFHDSPESRAILLAIAGQESGWMSRFQLGGPARGWWQFESEGAAGVMNHPAATLTLKGFCAEQFIPWDAGDLFEAVAWNDPLAYALARLLLWTDPHPLPALGDQIGALMCYDRLWRPGKPDATRWTSRYAEALAIEGGAVA